MGFPVTAKTDTNPMKIWLSKLWQAFLRRFRKATPPRPLPVIAREYFTAHADQMDGVVKATYAWHDPDLPDAHAFPDKGREAACQRCGRTRELVRHDDLPARCIALDASAAGEGDPYAGRHRYTSSTPWGKCLGCGCTREQNSDLDSPHPVRGTSDVARLLHNPHYGMKDCPNPVKLRTAKEVLARESELLNRLLVRSQKEVPRLVKKLGLSGETLAVLHHTHGCDPEAVTMALDAEHPDLAATVNSLMPDYELAMQRERERSRAAHKSEIVTVK